jgi:hypothetical protein
MKIGRLPRRPVWDLGASKDLQATRIFGDSPGTSATNLSSSSPEGASDYTHFWRFAGLTSGLGRVAQHISRLGTTTGGAPMSQVAFVNRSVLRPLGA